MKNVYVLIHAENNDFGTNVNVVGAYQAKEKAMEVFSQKRKEILNSYKEEELEVDYKESNTKKGYFMISAVEGWDSLEIQKVKVE